MISYTNSFHIFECNIVSLTADRRIHADNRAYHGDEQINFNKHIRSFNFNALDWTVTSEGLILSRIAETFSISRLLPHDANCETN